MGVRRTAFALALIMTGLNCRSSEMNTNEDTLDQEDCPFRITVDVTEELTVRAQLVNAAPVRHSVLHDRMIQPSELILESPAGQPIHPVDVRANRKFDNTVYRDMYESIDPGQKMLLFSVTPERSSDGTYTIEWGPFRFDGLRPGRYGARVRWTSARDSWTDFETDETGRVDRVWKGECVSDALVVELPPS